MSHKMLKLHSLRVGCMVAALFMAACARYEGARWLTVRDPDALACRRECLGQKHACDSGRRYATINGQLVSAPNRDCGEHFDACMQTCPLSCPDTGKGKCTTPEGQEISG